MLLWKCVIYRGEKAVEVAATFDGIGPESGCLSDVENALRLAFCMRKGQSRWYESDLVDTSVGSSRVVLIISNIHRRTAIVGHGCGERDRLGAMLIDSPPSIPPAMTVRV